jgi:hypothetical protein
LVLCSIHRSRRVAVAVLVRRTHHRPLLSISISLSFAITVHRSCAENAMLRVHGKTIGRVLLPRVQARNRAACPGAGLVDAPAPREPDRPRAHHLVVALGTPGPPPIALRPRANLMCVPRLCTDMEATVGTCPQHTPITMALARAWA